MPTRMILVKTSAQNGDPIYRDRANHLLVSGTSPLCCLGERDDWKCVCVCEIA